MPYRPRKHSPYPKRPRAPSEDVKDKNYRGSAHSRGYDRNWKRLRDSHLIAHPFCVYCERAGDTTVAHVVDHITPHKGDRALLSDPKNLQSLCYPHHNSTKQREERGKPRPRIGIDGLPIKDEDNQIDGGGVKT